MLYIFEGCDGAGKTTIARNFAAFTGARIIHCTKETPNTFSFFEGLIRASDQADIIADRFMYGQFVYQQAQERKLCKGELYELETMLLERKSQVYLVTASESEISKRLSKRNETIINGLTPAEVTQRFREVFTKISMLRVKEITQNMETGAYDIVDLKKV